ncbi:MAG: Nucleoside-diphosphate-sugar epimerase [Parcubacteria group bacterium GW2011_GWA2_31_28]|nr:MAG: Nucleoside-diphosphate-sugar epimerase [Parcubacteria group bacterium GW2011_GWA2_31_28]
MKLNYKNKNCIITGGAGFIGQGLVKRLLDAGASVFVIDHFVFGAKKSEVDKRAKIITGDVRDSIIFNKLPKIKYDYFFHFAAPSSIVLFNKNQVECIDITIRGFLNSIHFAAENNIRFIYPSTGSLYSGINPPHHEKAQLKYELLNTYAKNKVLLEKLADVYRPKVNVLGLRILAGYGPGENHKGKIASVIYSFCRDMASGKSPIIWGDGSQRRDFIFIDDIVSIILTLAINCKELIVNVGTGKDISFKEITLLINKYLNKNIVPVYVKKPKLYLEKTLADTRLLRHYYKKPLTPVFEGVKKTLQSL